MNDQTNSVTKVDRAFEIIMRYNASEISLMMASFMKLGCKNREKTMVDGITKIKIWYKHKIHPYIHT